MIELNLEPSCKYVYSDEATTIYVRIVLTGPEIKVEGRSPLNLAIVIDRSGSMRGERLEYAKKAAECIVENLANDFVSLVVYGDAVKVIFRPAIPTNKEQLLRLIREIRTQGTTNLSGGLNEGYKLLDENLGPNYINQLLLFSDGLANRGVTDPSKLAAMSKKQFLENKKTSTFGIGTGFNEDLLTAIADYGSGEFYFIENADDIPDIVSNELKGLLTTVGQSCNLTFQAQNGVVIKRVLSYDEFKISEPLLIGDLRSQDCKDYLLEIEVPKGVGSLHYLDVSFQYSNAIGEMEDIVVTRPLLLDHSNDEKLLKDENIEVMDLVAELRAAEMEVAAIKAFDSRDFDLGTTIQKNAISTLEAQLKKSPNVNLRNKLETLQELNRSVEEQKEFSPRHRKQTQFSSYSSKKARRK